MSAFSKKKKNSKTKKDITFHLYIQPIGDIQFSTRVYPYDTFRTICDKVIAQILHIKSNPETDVSQENVDQYHLVANAFPKLHKSKPHHPSLDLIIAPKLEDAKNVYIEQYAKELLSSNLPSISLNSTYSDHTWNKNSSLHILITQNQDRTRESININTLDDQIDHETTENINPNTNDQRRNHNKRTKKPAKHKTKKKKKTKRKSPKNKRKRRYESDTDYSTADDASQDDDDEYECDIDLNDRGDDNFIAPIKRRKIDVTEIKEKLSPRNPTSLIPLIHRSIPMYNHNHNHNHNIASRHRLIARRPRPNRNRNTRLARKQSKPNHLIILLDASRSMTSALNNVFDSDDVVSRLSMAINYIKRYIQRQWQTVGQKKTVISFATFGGGLDIKANTLKCCSASVRILMGKIVNLKKENDLYDDLETETAVYQLLQELMQMIKLGKMNRYKNTRILLFTDGENVSYAAEYGPIKNMLNYKKITVDCIQCSRGERDNVALKRICTQYSHQGRFWNPLTLQDWDNIFKSSDFLMPYSRGFVMDLTMDDSNEDSDEDEDEDEDEYF